MTCRCKVATCFVCAFFLAAVHPSSGIPSGIFPQSSKSVEQQADSAYQTGMQLLRQKEYAQALAQFDLVRKLVPNLPQGYSGEGIALALMGKPDEAIRALKKALEIDPTFWMARRELGIVYWQQNRKEDSARELEQVVQLFPTDPPVDFILGQFEYERGDYSRAVELFAKAPAQVQADAGVSLMEAQALLKTGNAAAAGQDLDRLAAAPGLTAEQQFNVAWLLGQAKRYKEAIRAFKALPRDYPDVVGRDYGLALAYFEDGQYGKCAEILSGLSARGVAKPEIFSLLGVAEEKDGKTLEAYSAFRQGIYKHPKDARNYLNIATLSVQHLSYDVALQVLSSAIDQIPDDYRLFATRGVVRTLRRELTQAQADYQKAVELGPRESNPYVALGICYMDQNRYDEAVATFQKGIDRQLKDVLLYYFLVDALMREGMTPESPRYGRAASAIESCLAIDPDFAYAYLQRARLELAAHDVSKGAADLERARMLEPSSREVLYQLAVVYRSQGRQAEAQELFAKVEQASKEDAEKFRQGKLIQMIVSLSGGNQ